MKSYEHNPFVPINPHYTEIDLDKKAEMYRACRQAANNMLNTKEKDFSLVYYENVKDKVKRFTEKFPSILANDGYDHFIFIEDDIVKWDEEALLVFALTANSWFDPWIMFERDIEKILLRWYEVDTIDMDREQVESKVLEALEAFNKKYEDLESKNLKE